MQFAFVPPGKVRRCKGLAVMHPSFRPCTPCAGGGGVNKIQQSIGGGGLQLSAEGVKYGTRIGPSWLGWWWWVGVTFTFNVMFVPFSANITISMLLPLSVLLLSRLGGSYYGGLAGAL